MVEATRGTRMRCFFASSTPLRIASGTSFDLPRPAPTTPLRSPTTTTALKLNRRPPLTTFATRLIWTTFSSRLSLVGSILVMFVSALQVEAALAGALGERANPPVVLIAAAVKDHGRDAGRLRPLRDRLANGMRCVDPAAADARFAAGGRGHGAPAGVVDHLRIDELRGTEDRQARPLGSAVQPQPEPFVALATQRVAAFLLDHAAPPTLPALPALRRICSPA